MGRFGVPDVPDKPLEPIEKLDIGEWKDMEKRLMESKRMVSR